LSLRTFFPPKPDGVSAHDDDVTLLPYLVLQSPCHSRQFIRKYFSPVRTLHFHQEQYTFVRGRRILLDPYPRGVNRNRKIEIEKSKSKNLRGHFSVTYAFQPDNARIKEAEMKSRSSTLDARRALRMRKKSCMSILLK
ncbi:hypothetical protein TNCV_2099001, partial [Trichonephila clavipes]